MSADYNLALEALTAVQSGHEPSDEQIEALASIVDLFAPYDGDTPEMMADQPRKLGEVRCNNCGYVDVSPATPSLLTSWAKAAQRRSVCPMCFCTTMLLGDGS